jgi:16S rRNA (cytidine1402-2'-O)-methyltransferase
MIDNKSTKKGKLYIVSTPIGHLDDLSTRARTVLAEVDRILAEDTRHSQKLLTELGLKKPLQSYHAHNENDNQRLSNLIKNFEEGESIALISDAGTPLISDPGYPLVHMARKEGVDVIPIPGPCALITALSASGLPCETFTFGGFLPHKSSSRKAILKKFLKTEQTLVFYESPHRIIETLKDVEAIFKEDVTLVLAKELTKIYETFVEGNPQALLNWFEKDPLRLKGEFVLIIGPRKIDVDTLDCTPLLSLLLKELPLKKAVQITSQYLNLGKNEVYEKALSLKEK